MRCDFKPFYWCGKIKHFSWFCSFSNYLIAFGISCLHHGIQNEYKAHLKLYLPILISLNTAKKKTNPWIVDNCAVNFKLKFVFHGIHSLYLFHVQPHTFALDINKYYRTLPPSSSHLLFHSFISRDWISKKQKTKNKKITNEKQIQTRHTNAHTQKKMKWNE